MEPKLRSLFHDPGYYVKAFERISALCDKYSAYADWVDTFFKEEVAAKIRASLGEQEELRVLGIGSGSGTKEETITRTVSYKKVEVVVIYCVCFHRES